MTIDAENLKPGVTMAGTKTKKKLNNNNNIGQQALTTIWNPWLSTCRKMTPVRRPKERREKPGAQGLYVCARNRKNKIRMRKIKHADFVGFGFYDFFFLKPWAQRWIALNKIIIFLFSWKKKNVFVSLFPAWNARERRKESNSRQLVKGEKNEGRQYNCMYVVCWCSNGLIEATTLGASVPLVCVDWVCARLLLTCHGPFLFILLPPPLL